MHIALLLVLHLAICTVCFAVCSCVLQCGYVFCSVFMCFAVCSCVLHFALCFAVCSYVLLFALCFELCSVLFTSLVFTSCLAFTPCFNACPSQRYFVHIGYVSDELNYEVQI